MDTYGLLVSYSKCNSCLKCVDACCQAHSYTPEQSGLKLSIAGPFQFPSGASETYYVATPTDYCDHCAACGSDGTLPACVHACSAGCISYGTTAQLGPLVTEKRMALFTLPDKT